MNLRTPEWGTLWSNVQRGGVPFYYMGRGTVNDPSACSPRNILRLAHRHALATRTRKSTGCLRPSGRNSTSQSASSCFVSHVAITEEAPAHFMLRHKLAWVVARNIEYKPLATTDILATDIRMFGRRGATREAGRPRS